MLVVIDAASNLLMVGAQPNKLHKSTAEALKLNWTTWNIRPRHVCGDDYFMDDWWKQWYKYHDIIPIELGPNTPWPNRAEAGVKQFTIRTNKYFDSIAEYESQEPGLRTIPVKLLVLDSAHVRNMDLTYGGKTPLEIASGRRPPDIIQTENMSVGQLTAEENEEVRLHSLRMKLAQQAHLEARQRLDIRRDLAARLLPSHGPLEVGEGIWYWQRDMSKIRSGTWIKAKVLVTEPNNPMVRIQVGEGKNIRQFLEQ